MKQILHGWSLVLTLALLTGLSSCSKDDAEAPATVNVGQSSITFKAFDTEAQTITIDASQDWTFEVTGDSQVCEVTREEGSNVLTITPNINYDNVAYTALIVISAGEGSAKATQTITVTQQANGETYLNFMDSSLNSDNPILTVENNPEGGETIYPIRLVTNNRLSVVYSEDQDNPTSQSLEKGTRVAIEGCDWITYEVSEEETADGMITALNLSCTYNEDTSKSRTAFLEIICGEGTKNTVLKKRLGITQMADTPTIIINAPEEGLVATYDQSKPLTFSVAGNVDFLYNWVQTPSWATLTETTEKGSESNVRNFSLEFSEWTGLSDREATLSFYAADGGADVAAADVKVIQTAAPKASISLNMTSVVFNNGEESKTKYVEIECSFSTMNITTKDLETETEPDWLTVNYDASAEAVSVKVDGSTEQTRSAEVQLYCGGNGNEASATFTVTQLGTEATLLLEPETVALDSKGSAQVVSVLTNQTDWSVVDATAEPAFTLNVDKDKNTITVSATTLDVGNREYIYTVKAGNIEKKLTVSQHAAYKVGDPYMVNGKPVGIVYQVDEAGQHGKAYALTVYNLSDKYFCYTEDVQSKYDGFNFKGNEKYAPLSRTDGLANQQLLMTIPNWETICQMTKWTVDLGKQQGVNWYIPAIEELKEMIEVMSNAKYTESDLGYDVLPSIEEVSEAWDIVRNLYKQYTTPENGYETSQRVIFQFADENYEYFIDGTSVSEDQWVVLDPASPETGYKDIGNWLLTTPGDDTGDRWFSSTVLEYQGYYRVYTAYFGYDSRGNGIINNDTFACKTIYDIDHLQDGGSVHPICQF